MTPASHEDPVAALKILQAYLNQLEDWLRSKDTCPAVTPNETNTASGECQISAYMERNAYLPPKTARTKTIQTTLAYTKNFRSQPKE